MKIDEELKKLLEDLEGKWDLAVVGLWGVPVTWSRRTHGFFQYEKPAGAVAARYVKRGSKAPQALSARLFFCSNVLNGGALVIERCRGISLHRRSRPQKRLQGRLYPWRERILNV